MLGDERMHTLGLSLSHRGVKLFLANRTIMLFQYFAEIARDQIILKIAI